MKRLSSLMIFLLSFTFANESTYTSIADKDCKTTEVFKNNMGASQLCEKFEFFEPEVIDSDARMSITMHRRGIAYPQRYASSVGTGFSSLGSKIEWRYAKDESYDPHAFIARVNFSVEDEHTASGFKEVSKLAVSKIDTLSICVVGVIPPQKNQNVLAREMADKAKTMPCLIAQQNTRETALQTVLKNHEELGKSAKTQKQFNYLRDMGPLEHALRILKEPSFPVWRVRMRLFAVMSEKFPSQLGSYRVVVDRINLSYALHDSLIEQYGIKNVDPTLKNTEPSESYTLEYMIMRTPAALIEESLDLRYDVYLEEEACGLKKSCTQLQENVGGDWGKASSTTISTAPWESKVNTFPAMLRALEVKAGWLENDVWSPQEIPEGMNETTPWVEIVIENHGGNGGGYSMLWQDLVSDDSIAKTLYSIYYDEVTPNTQADLFSAVLCGRGDNTTRPTQLCP